MMLEQTKIEDLKMISILKACEVLFKSFKNKVYNYIACIFKVKNIGAGEVGTFKYR